MWRCYILFIISFAVKAQPYGQYKYSHANVFTTAAFRTSINSSGHILAGYKANSILGTYNFCIDKTNPSGVFTSSSYSFKKEYQILNTASCGVGNINQILNCSGVSVIETKVPGSPSAWYALAGNYDEGCFFATLDSLGNTINTKAYLFPYSNPFSSAKTYIAESASSPGNYYLCGTHDSTVYVLKVNSSGSVGWSGYYHMGTSFFLASGIIECPFTGNVIIIGSANTPLSFNTATDGFLLSLDGTNGNAISYKTYSLPVGAACQQFTAIKPAYSGTGGQGYIIGGYTDSYPAQPWMLKIGVSGNIVWSTVIQPSTDPGASPVMDVIERPVGSTYEYYGAIKSNAVGMIVVKLDDNGIPVPTANNEFVFNTTSTVVASVNSLDFQTTGPNIALTTYGTVDGVNGGEMYMVRSYFNGKSGCNETNTVVGNYFAGPNTVITPWINRYGTLTACNMFQVVGASVNSPTNTLCNNSVVSGGSNSGVTTTEDINNINNRVFIFPNPTKGSFTLRILNESQSELKILISNSIGTTIEATKKNELISGDYSKIIDLEDFGLKNGIYFVRVIINGTENSYKVVLDR